MKSKDITLLIVAVLIFAVAGYIGYTQLVPHKATASTSSVTVEVVGSFPGSLNGTAQNDLNDSSTVKDFDSPVDLSGLNNTAPFGQ